MGVVYKARHRRLNRLVALKMIRGANADEIQIARFKIEAEAVAAFATRTSCRSMTSASTTARPSSRLSCSKGVAWPTG